MCTCSRIQCAIAVLWLERDINIRWRDKNAGRKYVLEVSIQTKFHAIHLRKTFWGTPVRVVQVPFELVFESDRANDDVQLMTKFRGSAKHTRDQTG